MLLAVAAELRFAGFRVVLADFVSAPATAAAIVYLQQRKDGVGLKVKLGSAHHAALIASAADGGMTADEADAIRIAEAVRSLVTPPPVTTPPPPAALHPPPPAPPAAPAATPPVAAYPYPPPWWYYHPPYPPQRPRRPDKVEPPSETVLRITALGGVGHMGTTIAIGGAGVKGRLSRHAFFQGMVFGVHAFDVEIVIEDSAYATPMPEGNMFAVSGVQIPLLFGWEPLGADNIWTPTLAAGLSTSLLFWEGLSETLPLLPAESSYVVPWKSGSALGLGPVAQLGLAVLRPFRLRIDLLAGVQFASQLSGADGDSAVPAIAPYVIGTFGFEIDVWTRPAAKPKAPSEEKATSAARR